MQNILLIMMDQLRYDALGFMGKFPVRTPNIDQLAARGTVFENAYCSNPVCVPARASLMTGVYSYDHGVYYNDQNWPEQMDTYAGRLAANCYYTTVIGKTHFLPRRKSAGFQKMILPEDYTAYLKRRGLYKPGTKGKISSGNHLNNCYPIEPTDLPLEHYQPVFYTDHALHELELISKRRECREEGNEPFMMKVSYSLPHTPCNPPEPYFSMYQPKDLHSPVRNEGEIERFSAQQRCWYDIWSQLDEERAVKNRAQYFGCVTLLDEQIGRIFRKLEELGIFDNTLIILTSDHGDHLCDHYLQQKGFFYDCSAKVPFIFAGPGIPAGKTVKENVSHIDLFPTIMEYCELAMPKLRNTAGELIYPDTCESDAISLIPYFSDCTSVCPERVVISENAVMGQHFMLKQGDVKINYYVNRNGENEFDYYNLATDPDELDNCGQSFSIDDLPVDMRKAFDNVLKKSARYASGHYFFQDKIRPMFT